jgi:sugar phosphate permease
MSPSGVTRLSSAHLTIVAITAVVILLAAGVRSAPGVFVVPIENDLGWQRAIVSTAVAFGILVFGLTAPFSGRLMDRFGPRLIVMIGLIVIAVSMATSALMTELWQLNLLWGALSGVGTGLIGSVLGATIATRWFVEKRGLITGIFGAATSAGQMIFVRLLARMAEEYGWRNASWVLALLPLLLLIPAWLLLRDKPEDVGARPFGAPAAWSGTTLAQNSAGVMGKALRSPTFWLLATTFFVCGFTSNGLIGTHFLPYAISCGYTPDAAANFLVLMGLFNFVGTIGSGWLTDRFDPRKLLFTYYALRGVSLILLPLVTDPIGLTVFAVLFGLDYIATVPPTIRLCADSFGRQNVGMVYGWVFCAHQIGAAVASALGGVAYDAFGDYLLAFVVAGFVGIAAGALSLAIGRKPAVSVA